MALYFIALLPPEDLSQQIRNLKTELSKKYHTRKALRLPAHITLQPPFHQDEHQQERLLEGLRDFTDKEKAFDLRLKGFGRFSRRVIFLDVANPGQVASLQRRLVSFLEKDFQIPQKENDRKFHPHITLATKDLDPGVFEQAWQEINNRKFQEQFRAELICLFRHEGQHWKALGKFRF